ncbi:hypothetical protein D3C85_1482510 [compost metagenome]
MVNDFSGSVHRAVLSASIALLQEEDTVESEILVLIGIRFTPFILKSAKIDNSLIGYIQKEKIVCQAQILKALLPAQP